MKKILYFLTFLFFLAACVPGAVEKADRSSTLAAEWSSLDIPHATIVYYDIAGSTAEGLRSQMDAFGPVGYDGYKGDATTLWSIRWNWPGFGQEVCDLQQAVVSYTIDVILPRWQPPDGVKPALLDQWGAYISALVDHEKGHVDYVVDQIPRIVAAIQHATCRTADAAADGILQDIREHDVQYDAETDHGKSQGAQFP
jgi:predicted secreted Zn-dependent protease